jgi:hypothetical protein
LQQLWRQRRIFIAQLRSVVERQLTELDVLESEPAPSPSEVAARESTVSVPTPSWLDATTEED